MKVSCLLFTALNLEPILLYFYHRLLPGQHQQRDPKILFWVCLHSATTGNMISSSIQWTLAFTGGKGDDNCNSLWSSQQWKWTVPLWIFYTHFCVYKLFSYVHMGSCSNSMLQYHALYVMIAVGMTLLIYFHTHPHLHIGTKLTHLFSFMHMFSSDSSLKVSKWDKCFRYKYN